jgi:hypothetical protein
MQADRLAHRAKCTPAAQAAESGDAVAQYVLGTCFKAGRGTSVNYPKVRRPRQAVVTR